MLKNGNGFLKNKTNLNLIQKAVMTTVGATTSRELIKKAAIDLYDDIHEVVSNLVEELKERGEITAKHAKVLIKEIQKKSETEKAKMSKKLEKDSKVLLKRAKDMILTPIIIGNQIASALAKKSKVKKNSKAKRKTR